MANVLPPQNDESEFKLDKELKKHGGQDWKLLTNYVEDFSVTTNGLSTPISGLKAIRECLGDIDHYPPLDNEPALTDLSKFIWRDNNFLENKKRLILGNGASELVDIIMRVCKENNVQSFRPGPSRVQYKDYERCAKQNKFKILPYNDDSADLLSIVNPTNPTGDFMDLESIKKYITLHAAKGSSVIVDESMIFWYGENWRKQSLSSQTKWINDLYSKKNVSVFINFSWTKIWKCCGIRIGSIIAPNDKLYNQIKSKQCPWSVNILGLSFISAVSKDDNYMKETWRVTKLWRSQMVKEIYNIFNIENEGDDDVDNDGNNKNTFNIKLYGEDFLSWIWCDTFNELLAKLCTESCRTHGVPIRHAIHGYKQGTCIRFGVRSPQSQKVLYNALRNAKKEYFMKTKQ